MKNWLLQSIRLYQKYFSRPGVCRFSPSCSEYTYQAVAKYGILHGMFLGVIRILKCNPFFQGGYNPI